MHGKSLLLGLLVSGTLFARDAALDSLQIDVADLSQAVKSQRSEIEILTEKLHQLQVALDGLKEEPTSTSSGLEPEKMASLEKRLTQMEKNAKTFIADLKTLKEHFNQSSEEVKSLENSFAADIKTLKSSIHSVISLLEGKGEKNYVVKSGDSLGKIAQEHQVSIKRLKEANQLETDQIVVGQKIKIPPIHSS